MVGVLFVVFVVTAKWWVSYLYYYLSYSEHDSLVYGVSASGNEHISVRSEKCKANVEPVGE